MKLKTKKRQAEELAAKEAEAAARGGVPPAVREWLDRGAAYASPRVELAREWAGPRFVQARDWASPRLEDARGRGVELAAPRIEAAVGRIAPAVDATRDRIVEEVLPKVVAAAQAAAAKAAQTRDERLDGADSAPTGKKARRAAVLAAAAAAAEPPRRHRIAKVFWVLSVLGAVAAAVAVFLRRRNAEVDPWAQPYPAYPPIGDPSPTPAAGAGVGGADDRPDEQQPETDVLTEGATLDGTGSTLPGQHDGTFRSDS